MKSHPIPTTLLAATTLCAVCISCGGGNRSDTAKDGLVTIDIAANYPTEQITLQDIAEVEYIPLALSPEVLLTPTDRVFHLSESHIMVANRGRGDINIFNRDGTIATHFNRSGRGPGEYMTISDIAFDATTGEIFVMDMVPPQRIHVYSPIGIHRRTLTLPEGWRITAWNFDPETLLVYDDGGTGSTMGSAQGFGYSQRPYYLVSKADASITDTLAIRLPTRYSTQTVLSRENAGPDGQTLYQAMMISTTNHRLGAPEGAFTLADISSDTIYTYTRERVLTPVFVRTPSVHASEPRTVWTTPLNTTKFTLLEVTTLDFKSAQEGNGFDQRTLMYDHSTGRVTQPTFRDANNPGAQWSPSYFDVETPGEANTAATLLDPLRLTEARDKGELHGPLAQIAEKIKEDDNPVLMTVKFNR